jgi:hypothetical protein
MHVGKCCPRARDEVENKENMKVRGGESGKECDWGTYVVSCCRSFTVKDVLFVEHKAVRRTQDRKR